MNNCKFSHTNLSLAWKSSSSDVCHVGSLATIHNPPPPVKWSVFYMEVLSVNIFLQLLCVKQYVKVPRYSVLWTSLWNVFSFRVLEFFPPLPPCLILLSNMVFDLLSVKFRTFPKYVQWSLQATKKNPILGGSKKYKGLVLCLPTGRKFKEKPLIYVKITPPYEIPPELKNDRNAITITKIRLNQTSSVKPRLRMVLAIWVKFYIK